MRKINRNLSGIPSRMTDLSGNPSSDLPSKMNIALIKKFEDLKGAYNDCLAFEAQCLREKDPQSRDLFLSLYTIRRQRLYDFLQGLEKDLKERLHLLLA